jgi:hypothetical protein
MARVQVCKTRQRTDACANKSWVAHERLKSIGGRFHQQPVSFLRVGAGQWTQFCREREGKQEVVAGQEAAALLVPASVRFDPGDTWGRSDCGRSGVGKHLLLAVIALIHMSSKERRATSGNIPQSAFLNRTESVGPYCSR